MREKIKFLSFALFITIFIGCGETKNITPNDVVIIGGSLNENIANTGEVTLKINNDDLLSGNSLYVGTCSSELVEIDDIGEGEKIIDFEIIQADTEATVYKIENELLKVNFTKDETVWFFLANKKTDVLEHINKMDSCK